MEDAMSVRDLIPWGRERVPSVQGGEVMDPFLSLHREMNRLFEDVLRGFEGRTPFAAFGGRTPFAAFGGLAWPRLDVVDTEKEYRVTAELPGLDEKDVELSIRDGVLTLKGERKLEHDGGGALHSERYYGRFQRSFSFGPDVDEDRITASFRNGVLTVVLPKVPESGTRAKRIRIDAN